MHRTSSRTVVVVGVVAAGVVAAQNVPGVTALTAVANENGRISTELHVCCVSVKAQN